MNEIRTHKRSETEKEGTGAFFKDKENIDAAYIKAHLPPRRRDSHKGSYGRLHIFAGSKQYRGAAILAAEGALRTGVGLVTLSSEETVLLTVGERLPELLLDARAPVSAWTEEEIALAVSASESANAVLVGPGAGVSPALYRFVYALSRKEGAPLALDADALNAIAAYADGVDGFFAGAARPILLTPHPLELGRLVRLSAKEVQARREALTRELAKRWGVALLLKGADTLVADGERLLVNTSGSSALSKGGSGDVLAGAVGAFLAQGAKPVEALALAAYLHGKAGDTLAEEYSEYGVLPSELPRQMAKLLAKI